jgi:hypothetical protein
MAEIPGSRLLADGSYTENPSLEKIMHYTMFLSLLPSAPLIIWLSRRVSHARPAKRPYLWLLLSGIGALGWHFCCVQLVEQASLLTQLESLSADTNFYEGLHFAYHLQLAGLAIGAGTLAIAFMTIFLCSRNELKGVAAGLSRNTSA